MNDLINTSKLGLVLAGGGAKGAYQVGVMKALCLVDNISIKAIAGASIGALNGAVIAASPTLKVAHRRLERIWKSFSKDSPILPNIKTISTTLAEYVPSLSGLAKVLGELLQSEDGLSDDGLMTNKPIQKFLEKYCGYKALSKGIPLIASLYREEFTAEGILSILLYKLKLSSDTKQPDYLHIQALSPREQKKALLASAAIPLAFDAQVIQGTRYSDGGQGAWNTQMGNIPLPPLIQRKLKNILVVHMDYESLVNKQEYPGVKIVEIHPRKKITSKGTLPDVSKFADHEFIKNLIRQGQQDTIDALNGLNGLDL
jgi:NTE family protein